MKKLLIVLSLSMSMSALAAQVCNLTSMEPVCGGDEKLECVVPIPNGNLGICVNTEDMSDGISGTNCNVTSMRPICAGSASHECVTVADTNLGVCIRN